jgi:hypothetical protein
VRFRASRAEIQSIRGEIGIKGGFRASRARFRASKEPSNMEDMMETIEGKARAEARREFAMTSAWRIRFRAWC